MADSDKASKTEDPTPRRLEEAHAKGQFAKSEEIGTVFILIATTVVLLFAAGSMGNTVAAFSAHLFGSLNEYPLNQERAAMWLVDGIYLLVNLLLPMMAASFVAGLLAGGLQSGFKLTMKAMEPNPSKLNPISGMQNILSLKSVAKFVVDVLKMLAVGLIMYGVVRKLMDDPIFYMPVPLWHLPEFIWNNSILLLFRVIMAMSVIAMIHYLYMRWQTHEDMKMTRQEVKDERKQSEGDPLVKSAQRRFAIQIARKQMAQGVPTADVVVTNPTHYAVALRYERGRDVAPVVVAKGENLFALRIKEIAREHGVPMVENRPLARMLFRVGRVGESIPTELYQVVADVLAHVYRTHKYYFHRLRFRRVLNA